MSINHIMLVGRLGAAPELRTTASGKPVCNLRVATSRWKADGNNSDADWHQVVAWNKTAEQCHQYLDKGSQVAIEGRLTYRDWKAHDGSNRTSSEIIAHRVVFVGAKKRRTPELDAGVPF